MEEEIKKYIQVWVSAVASLTYCYLISFNIPKGKFRFLSFLPVFYLLTVLPLNLTTFYLGSTTGFFLTWLANFNLLLFSFGQGPLSTNPSISLVHFIFIACSPARIKSKQPPSPLNQNPIPYNQENQLNIKTNETPSPQISKKSFKQHLHLAIKVLTFLSLILAYKHQHHLHSKIVTGYYFCYTYLGLELIIVATASLCRILFGLEFEPLFNEPYLSTSLQDFWSRRWNLAASRILRLTVYQPIKSVINNVFGRKVASGIAVLSTFLVSGLIHEVIYYQVGRETPTWEVTWFFVVHGVLVVAEAVVKKMIEGRVSLHPVVSCACTLGIMLVTADWLFLPQLLRCGADVRARTEIIALFYINR